MYIRYARIGQRGMVVSDVKVYVFGGVVLNHLPSGKNNKSKIKKLN